jgi:hypothetical protein
MMCVSSGTGTVTLGTPGGTAEHPANRINKKISTDFIAVAVLYQQS